MLRCKINTDFLVNIFCAGKLLYKVKKGMCYEELSQGRHNAAVDNYFYYWAVLVYFEENV